MASQPTELHIQNVQSRAGFVKMASPANQRLDRFSLLVGQTKRDAILACAEPVILLPGRPFTLTHIHEICTKFNESYTLQRMANYGYAFGNRSVRSTQGLSLDKRRAKAAGQVEMRHGTHAKTRSQTLL